MASSEGSSSGLGWRDIAGNLVAFEAINGVRLEIRISTADYHGRADLAVSALAHNMNVPIGEAPSLASVSLTISATRLKSLEGVLIHVLYLLDAKLAENEIKKNEGG